MKSLRSENSAARVQALKEQLADRDRRLAEQQAIVDGILQSRSWRWTEALRQLARRIRGLLGRASHPQIATPNPKVEPAVPAEPAREAGPADQAPTAETPDVKAQFDRLTRTVLNAFLASGARLAVPTSDAPVVSVVLVVWNRAELTFSCLRSLAEPQGVPFELIVVDNGSTDETIEMFERVDGVRMIRNEENRYFIRAVNQGGAAARGRHVMLINNDAVLLPGSMAALVATMESSDDIGSVGGKIVFLDGHLQEAGNMIWGDGSCLGYGRGGDPLDAPYMFRRDVDYCSGALLLLRKDLFDRLEGFDLAYNPAYYEETDFCVRLWKAGFRSVFEPAAAILHYEFASRNPAHASRLQIEKREVFVGKHSDWLAGRRALSPENILLSRIAGTQQRILVIDERVPHPHLGSGFPRAHRMITGLARAGRFVTFYPLANADESWDDVYADLPREVEVMLGRGPEGLERFLEERRGYYDAILVSRPHNMKVLGDLLARRRDLAGTRIVYDAEAIFATRDLRKMALDGVNISAAEHRKRLDEEVALARLAETVLSVSEAEASAFRERGFDAVHVLGHALETRPTPQTFDERSGFLFIGAIYDDETPNGDSLLWFVEEVMPRIRKRIGTVSLLIAGINRSEKIWDLASDEIRILGPQADLTPLYGGSRVFIAPTRFSAGMPHKIHEAAAFGLPAVATPLLAGQLGWSEPEHLMVGQEPEDFADRCIALYSDPVLWGKVRSGALERVKRDCSPDAFERKLEEVFSRPLVDAASRK